MAWTWETQMALRMKANTILMMEMILKISMLSKRVYNKCNWKHNYKWVATSRVMSHSILIETLHQI